MTLGRLGRVLSVAFTLPFGVGAPASAEDWPTGSVTTPSNLHVTLQDLIFEEQPYSGELHVVVRLLAPLIAGDGIESSELREDMDWACETWGLPAAATLSTAPDRVVIEMMEAPTERGVPNREVRQLFEVYRLEGSVCIWELY